MPRKFPHALWLALPLAYLLYFYHLGAVGLLGPDEPRYASIAREMARSGDWITPRLWGHPWFEKPALLYWMNGAAFRMGLGPDIAPRLPVTLLAVAFLAFYWWILNREFGCRAATIATTILGTTAAWWGFSQVGVTDLPLTATFSAAMLLALPWIHKRDTRFLPLASALLGFAVLAKSLPAIALTAPLMLRWRWIRDLLRPRVILPYLAIALPWHILCYLRNGREFPYTLFVQHQFGRATSDALGHPQPWWFYIPVLIGLTLPWSPLLLLWARRWDPSDLRRLFLLAWILFGLLFFSVVPNKLPGYVLPLVPAVAALLALTLEEVPRPSRLLAACALLLGLFPIAGALLPAAVANGLSRASGPSWQWSWLLLPAAFGAAVWLLETRSRRVAAVLCLAAGFTVAIVSLKITTLPQLDRAASARPLWQQIDGRAQEVCAGKIDRSWQYGLNYYSVIPLPECAQQPRPLQVVQSPGMPPEVVPSLAGPVDPREAGIVPSRIR